MDNRKLKQVIQKLIKNWQGEGKQVAEALLQMLNDGTNVVDAVKMIKKYHPAFFELPQLHDALVDLALEGYGTKAELLTPLTLAKVKHSLGESWDGKELVSLSKRIQGMSDEMQKTIIHTIQDQMLKNKTWVQASRLLYDGYNAGHLLEQADIPKYLRKVRYATGNDEDAIREQRKALQKIERLARNGSPTKALKTAYKDLVESVREGTEKEIEKAVWVACQEKSRYIAERIIRTEGARAWADGFLARTEQDTDVIGYQWIMDARHPVIDVCDFYADADLYGMGAGVFPKGHAPSLPAHPHCLCRFVEVYKGECPKPANQVDKAGKKYLNKCTDFEKRRLLGVKGAEQFDKDGSWKTNLRGFALGKQESRLTDILPFIKQTPKPNFVEAKTIEEAQNFAQKFVVKKTWSGDGNISFKGLSIEQANNINRTLNELYETYNIPLLRNIQPMNFKQNIWKNHTDTIMAYRNTFPDGEYFFNARVCKNLKTFFAYFEKGNEAYEICKNNIDKFTGSKRELIETYVKAGRSLVADTQNKEDVFASCVQHEMGHYIHRAIIERNKAMAERVRKSYQNNAINISGYATTSVGEYVAECFASFNNREFSRLDDIMIEIFEELKK